MSDISLPFDPLRDSLYTPADLFQQFSPADPDSYAHCPDIDILRYFVRHGTNPSYDTRASTLEALHDDSISKATQSLLKQYPKVVAIMGGHGMLRGTQPYADIAHISHALAQLGFLIVSGGGPGAMEASHLGAAFAALSVNELDTSIDTLSKTPSLPENAKDLVKPDGTVDLAIARALHAWMVPAIAIANALTNSMRPSLGVPTWLYGFEPTTPFATNHAKYFQNSLREDGLVTIGVQGIIYAEGKAGTVQEIFQDCAQNYYDSLSPMVFLSSPANAGDHYWEKSIPVRPLIEALLGKKPGFAKNVRFLDSAADVVAFFSGP